MYQSLDDSFWSNNETPLTKQFVVDHISRMEDHDGSIVVDFANKFIGGGALSRGAVQEEIMFLIYP